LIVFNDERTVQNCVDSSLLLCKIKRFRDKINKLSVFFVLRVSTKRASLQENNVLNAKQSRQIWTCFLTQ